MSQMHPLTEYRVREKLSKADLARLLNVSKGTVTRWESGLRAPDIDRLPDIAEKTGIPAAVLRPDLKAKMGIA